jgi:hypothetical protein
MRSSDKSFLMFLAALFLFLASFLVVKAWAESDVWGLLYAAIAAVIFGLIYRKL